MLLIRKRVLTQFSITACSALACSAVIAGLTAIQVQTEPITVGQVVAYVATEDGKNGPGTWSWDFRATSGGNQGQWVPLSNGSTTSRITEDRVGSYNVRCTGSYAGQTTSVIIRSITVNGPDHDVLTKGLDSPTSQVNLEVDFDVLNGAIPIGIIGSSVNGFPQERIRRPQNNNFDSGFVGPTVGSYYTQGYTIVDIKQTNLGSSVFVNAAIGEVIDDFYQQNRMVIKDGFNQDQFFYFPERHFQRVKTGINSWKLIQIQ